MSKAFRVMLWPVMQIAATVLAFGVIVLAGLALIPSRDNLFTMYYQMFPMLAVVIGSMSSGCLRPYINLALSMNGKRSHLFVIQQVYLVLLALLGPVCTKLLWLAGGTLYQPADQPVPFFVLLAAVSLLLSELMVLVTGIQGKARIAVYTVSIIITVIFCGCIGAYTALMEAEGTPLVPLISDQWLIGGALGLAAVSAVLAAAAWVKMRKAVVEV